MRTFAFVAALAAVLGVATFSHGAEPAPANPRGSSFLEEVRGEGLLLAEERNERIIQTQITKAEIDEAIRLARTEMRENPQRVIDALKLQLERIDNVAGIEPDAKARLRNQLAAVLREAARSKVEDDARRQSLLAGRAAASERTRRADALERTQDKLQQIVDRFTSLMNEGRYREAEELASVQAAELDRGATPTAAEQWARERNYHEQAMAVRDAAQRNFVDAMYQVERSHVPFPDEPPITYPDPQVWQELTLRRKKYASIDLAKRGSREEKILAELDNTTRLEFIETPLSEIMDVMQDLHGIPIEFDRKALNDVGIDISVPVTRNLSGISLRSALRLTLKELDLTYIIRDEVLLITTPEEADTKLATKVYPVADLVLPISSGMGANPFMLGGGLGGQGGFGGGMGGGMGQQGGGMGMGQQGAGMGMGNGFGNNGFGL